MDPRLRVVALTGATASGKATLAQVVASACGAELLSCDSMKVYRLMDIGTAKPSREARERVRWHLIDLVWPWESFDTGRFAARAEEVLVGARERGAPVLVSGGTPLYLKALTEGIIPMAGRDEGIRARLVEQAAERGSGALHERLAAIDPASALRIHPNDLRRIVRALELHELTGERPSALRHHFGRVRDGVERVVFSVERERADLDERIGKRVERMFRDGLLAECRELLDRPQGLGPEASQALGYRECFEYLREGTYGSEAALVDAISRNTRRFARRQLNWLRNHFPDLIRLPVPRGADVVALHLETVAAALRGAGGGRPAAEPGKA